MRNLVLLIVLLLGGAAGWTAGGWSGRTARADLARAEETGKAAAAAHAAEADTLKAKLASLSTDFERDKKKLEDEHNRQSSEASALIASSQSRIAELSKARSGSQTDLQRLRSELAAAKTPQEQKAITERIVVKQVEVQRQDGQIAGETCLAAPVPDRLLATWRGVAL